MTGNPSRSAHRHNDGGAHGFVPESSRTEDPMSWLPTTEPVRVTGEHGPVALVLEGRPRDLGGFSVQRVLPARERRAVGPFVFFDHFGPMTLPPGVGMDVRPHPHIGLATVTYL